jgi:hypothetical protein
MKVLKDFLDGFDFVKMKPERSVVKSQLPKECHCQALVEAGKQYAVYFHGSPGSEISVDLPQGDYAAEWVNVLSGKVVQNVAKKSSGGETKIPVPAESKEIALRVRRQP